MDLNQLLRRLVLFSKTDEDRYIINQFILALDNFLKKKDSLIASLKEGKSVENNLAILIEMTVEPLNTNIDYINFLVKDKEVNKIIREIKNIIKNIIKKLAKKNLADVNAMEITLEKAIKKLTENLNIVNTRRTSLSAEKEYIIEASSYFRKQRDKSKIFDRESAVRGIGRIKDYAEAGQIPRKPQATEPHCYGGAPNHLNSVILRKAGRLVFYMYPNESSNIIRLCAYIDAKTHNDAVNAVQERPGNIYWLIIKHKINRLYFTEFKKINQETLEDL